MNTPRTRHLLVGVGNAGVTVLDLLAMESPGTDGLIVVNNDAESLTASVVASRLEAPTGDPADGFLAIDGDFAAATEGSSSVVLCGGLGGDFGSFLIPALAIHAKSAGITVAACVAMPFSFEGRRKCDSAAAALEKLRSVCDAVMVIENDRLSGGGSSTSGVGQAFLQSDKTLLAALRALRGILMSSGPVRITRADLKNVLGVPGSSSLFGFGTANGSNRLHDALEQALGCPLLNLPGKSSRGSALSGASSVLILMTGPADLSFAEVQTAVAAIERLAGENCLIRTGVHADLPEGSPVTIYLASSAPGGRVAAMPVALKDEGGSTPSPAPESGTQPLTAKPLPKPAPKPVPPAKKTPQQAKQTQGTLDLDTHQRGRFEKSEPTIVAGEDLDIPTFLRKGIKLTSPRRS
jgi:cell division protein FtsZ